MLFADLTVDWTAISVFAGALVMGGTLIWHAAIVKGKVDSLVKRVDTFATNISTDVERLTVDLGHVRSRQTDHEGRLGSIEGQLKGSTR